MPKVLIKKKFEAGYSKLAVDNAELAGDRDGYEDKYRKARKWFDNCVARCERLEAENTKLINILEEAHADVDNYKEDAVGLRQEIEVWKIKFAEQIGDK